jgi:hypothetical protein
MRRRKTRTPTFNAAESPLMWLYRRQGRGRKPMISFEQFTAGEILRSDFEKTQLAPKVIQSYGEQAGKGPLTAAFSDNAIGHLSDAALDARDRVHVAFEAVGPELSSILFRVVCLAAGVEHAEAVMNLPPRSGKVVLSLALTRLARHYGIKDAAKEQKAHAPSRLKSRSPTLAGRLT